MTENAHTPLTLVPPTRLGSLLREARERRARSVEQVSHGSPFTAADLVAIESGERVLADAEIDSVIDAYQLDPGEIVPERSQLVVDLDEHRLVAGGEVRTLAGEAPSANEVLASYLSLVYTLRHTEPGTPLVLRDADVSVLSRVLQLAQAEVETRLHELMIDSDGEVKRRVGLLRGKVLLPLAGIVVAATAVGVLLLVQANDDPQPAAPPAAEAPAAPAPGVGDVELGPSSVMTPDGGLVITGNNIPASEIPDDATAIAPAQAAERNEDGSVTQYTVVVEDESTSTTGG